ncbi:rCG62766 [Rattus norvegicus]|uniref:RCG62766 n=1 Tax=Rattus norvegicus TaxID=10116 RepID=A6J5P8_RAT|nr:rCG62766 [Rattus norvegicus]
MYLSEQETCKEFPGKVMENLQLSCHVIKSK